MKEHGTIEKADTVQFGDADDVVRVVYWWRRPDNEVYRHTSYFKVEGVSIAGIEAATHLAEILNTAAGKDTP